MFDNQFGNMLNEMFELVLSERRYYDTTMTATKYQKVKNADIYDGIPYANWPSSVGTTDLAIPNVFQKQNAATYQKFEHNISTETLKGAKVSYNPEGYYEITLDLDLENPKTTESKLKDVIAGTGDKNAKFTKLDVKFQVWNSGYFKSFSYFEIWEAKAWVVNVAGEFDNNEVFSYDPRDCDLENYYDCYLYRVNLGLIEPRDDM